MFVAVKRWVIDKLLADEKWCKQFCEAKSETERERILLCFCKKQGVQVHHDVVTGRLVQK